MDDTGTLIANVIPADTGANKPVLIIIVTNIINIALFQYYTYLKNYYHMENTLMLQYSLIKDEKWNMKIYVLDLNIVHLYLMK